MPYVDEAYYNNAFYGEPVETADFPSLCLRAEEVVEEMTMYRLTPVAFPAMPAAARKRVKDAVCAQIEYLAANGMDDLDNGANLQSAGLGKYSYNRATGAEGPAEQSIFAPRALRILMPTGLLCRGGDCV